MSWRDLAGVQMPEGVDDDIEMEDKAHRVQVIALEGDAHEEEAAFDPDTPLDLYSLGQQLEKQHQRLNMDAQGRSESTTSTTQGSQPDGTKRVRRSRWGGDDESHTSKSADTGAQTGVSMAESTHAAPVPTAPSTSAPAVSSAVLAPPAADTTQSSSTDATAGSTTTIRKRSRWAPNPATTAASTAPVTVPAPPTTTPAPDAAALAALQRVQALASTLSLGGRMQAATASATPQQPAPATSVSSAVAASIIGGTSIDSSHPEYAKFMELRQKVELYQTKLGNVTYWLAQIPAEERSPSPDAIYDEEGRRVNTRERRYKDKLIRERNLIIEQAQRIDPTFSVVGYRRERPFMKIPIPVDEYPDYNFSGTIIGPRGHTQKRLEQETGCKISVRGKDANKDKAGRRKPQPDDNEPMHVFVQGETMEDVEKAAAIIRDLLVVRPEEENEHKSRQLRELAALNGFVRDESRRLQAMANKPGQPVVSRVVCGLCGATTHATMDCKRRQQGVTEQDFEAEVYKDFENFMSSLGGDALDASAPTTQTSQPYPPAQQLSQPPGGNSVPMPPPTLPVASQPFVHPQRLAQVDHAPRGYSQPTYGAPGTTPSFTAPLVPPPPPPPVPAAPGFASSTSYMPPAPTGYTPQSAASGSWSGYGAGSQGYYSAPGGYSAYPPPQTGYAQGYSTATPGYPAPPAYPPAPVAYPPVVPPRGMPTAIPTTTPPATTTATTTSQGFAPPPPPMPAALAHAFESNGQTATSSATIQDDDMELT